MIEEIKEKVIEKPSKAIIIDQLGPSTSRNTEEEREKSGYFLNKKQEKPYEDSHLKVFMINTFHKDDHLFQKTPVHSCTNIRVQGIRMIPV